MKFRVTGLAGNVRSGRIQQVGGLPAGGVESQLHFAEPVVGINFMHQFFDLGVLCDGKKSEAEEKHA